MTLRLQLATIENRAAKPVYAKIAFEQYYSDAVNVGAPEDHVKGMPRAGTLILDDKSSLSIGSESYLVDAMTNQIKSNLDTMLARFITHTK